MQEGYNTQKSEEMINHFKNTVKEHFRYGYTDFINIGKPLLSSRAGQSNDLRRLALEKRIMASLEKTQNKEQIEQFKDASMVASQMLNMQ